MTPTQSPDHETAPADDYRRLIIAAYAAALDIDPGTITEPVARASEAALIAHAADDAAAAHQAGISLDQLAHDTTTISATDGRPLIITADIGTAGRFYFARPEAGWPVPGHRYA